MPNQDGLRFLFDIQDKISAKTAKIEARAIRSAKNIDKAFTRISQSQQKNTTKAVASEQRRIVAVEKSHAKAIKLLQRESDAFKRSMGRMAAAATVAFAAVAGKAIQMAGGYDQAMRSVQAKTGATGELMDRLSEQSREMGRTTVHSATEAARGQAFLAQAGFDVNEVLEALPATLALATAGELDLASAADIASNVLSGFRLETEQTARVADVLASIASKTNTNISQMGEALSKAAPAAAAAGWSLEETAAAIGRLSDAGIQGEEAGTVLKTMLARLAAPTGKLAELMTEVGVNVTDATGKMLPLNDIIAQLAPHADNTGLMFELLGTRGANAGLVLGALGDKNLRDLTSELENSEGAAQQMADTMSGGLWGAIKEIQSIIESAYISLGERFEPAVRTLAAVFKKLPAPIQEVVVVVGSLAGAMGGLMLMMPGVFGAIGRLPGKLVALNAKIGLSTWSVKGLTLAIKNGWRALMGPVGWVLAIGAATIGLYKFWKATNAPDKKLERFEKQLEMTNLRLIEFADTSPRLVEELGHQKDALERQIAALKKSHPELEQAEEDLLALTAGSQDLADAIDNDLIPSVEKLGIATITTAVSELANFHNMQNEFRNEAATTTAWLQKQQDDRVAAARAAASAELDVFWKMDLDFRAKSAATTAWLKQQHAARQAAVDAWLSQLAGGLEESEDAGMSFGAAMQSVAGSIGGAFKRVIDVVSNVGSALAKGDWIGAAIAGATAFYSAWAGAIDSWVNGALMRINDLRDALNDMWASVDSGALSAAEAWERLQWVMNNPETGAAQFDAQLRLQQLIEDTGRTAVEAERLRLDWSRRWAAATTDAELKLLTQERARWAEEAAAQAAATALMDSAISAAISAYDRAKQAGIDAYDKIYLAAIESGATQEEAIVRATAAQLDASEKILAAEGKKFARLAAFEAALEAIRSGNAAGAAEAARKAAAETQAAWEVAMGAVAEADQAASDAMNETWNPETGDVVTNAQGTSDVMVEEMAAAERDIKIAFEKMAKAAETKAVDIETAFNAIEISDVSFKISEHREFSYSGHQDFGDVGSGEEWEYEERQHGGPVSAGRRYLVGEAGPELFVPSRSGRIDPNVSSGGGGVDAKALAKAVADALHGTRVDVDGRQLGRLTIRHQPLAVAELGGRR